MDNFLSREHRARSRSAQNDEFLHRLFQRRPQERERFERMLAEQEAIPEASFEAAIETEAADLPASSLRELVVETIVNEERPVLFVSDDWIDTESVTAMGPEAEELVQKLVARRSILQPLMPLIGRIDVTNFPNNDFVGSGWMVDKDIVVTNRHVASLIARWDGRQFAFTRGVGGQLIGSSFDTLHEFDDLAVDEMRRFAVKEVLYIEPEQGPDIAFLRIDRPTDGSRVDRITIAAANARDNVEVVVVGYPARAPRRVIPDQDLMRRLYRDRYDVKRAAPGFTMSPEGSDARHDCTTLGGNSGSCVLDMNSGEALGLHFAGLYQEANYAVPASVLNEYVRGNRWNRPHVVETAPRPSPPPPPQRQAAAAAAPTPGIANTGGAVTVTIPLSITVSLGEPTAGGGAAFPPNVGQVQPPAPVDAEAALKAFWRERPEGVVAARIGFASADGAVGEKMFLAASVPASQVEAAAARGPTAYRGLPVRYFPANAAEQIDSEAMLESVDRIRYDDAARSGAGFSFEPVEEAMLVRAHIGPEYSWEELKGFLDGASGKIVSAMYEFHAEHVKDAIEKRLDDGASLQLVLDNATFTDGHGAINARSVFQDWKTRYRSRFDRVVAPEGVAGLISDSYHIKVTVRDDDTFWLSSGNWKGGSSQPVVTQAQRDNADEVDLPGNREWHVVIGNATLAQRFRNHIRQDFKTARTLGGLDAPRQREAADDLIEVVIEAPIIEERRPPRRVLTPLMIERPVRVTPLLTPDREGAVYSEAVLELIRSARASLLFQIPYIAMPSNPLADRGYIDALLRALTDKLKTLPDARVLLRTGSSKFSAPTHAAWYFKSKGVDIGNRLRAIENHHTKGMIVDGKRVLIGSHNWSRPGVSLNRDASLIFDDAEIAAYFGEAFEIDWARANPINPKQYVQTEAGVARTLEAAAAGQYRRIPLSELMKEDE